MTDPNQLDGSWMSRDELEAVTEFLRSRRGGATVLEITRGTRLSAVVVVPALNQLMSDGIVRRRMFEAEGSGPRSAFALTSVGRRNR
jgi:predicted transcriptional regulator